MLGRPATKYNDSSPGPTAYTPQLGLSAPSFSIAGRRKANEFEKTPGPGAYSSTVSSSGPAISMKGRYEAKPDHDQPGPGMPYRYINAIMICCMTCIHISEYGYLCMVCVIIC